MSLDRSLPAAVIGAGPVGLAAAAHLVRRDLTPLVLEASDDVAASVRAWGHVRLFSPWRYDVDRAAAALLEAEGWRAPAPDALPTGRDLVEQYLRPLGSVPSIARGLRLGARVVSITRAGRDKMKTAGRGAAPFVLRVRDRSGAESEIAASAVIDATGTWGTPNPIGASGVPARGESEVAGRIAYGIPDVLGAARPHYEGQRTLVVGSGHSAANVILALAELADGSPGTSIVWAVRGDDLTRAFGGGAADGLPARGKLGADLKRLVARGRLELVLGFRVDALRMEGTRVVAEGTRGGRRFKLAGVDRVVAATGQRPDLAMTRELRVSLDPALECVTALAPLIDPNQHSCGTVRPHGAVELAHPEPDFYVIGNKSYGRAPTFLLATGYEQARSVVAMLAGDREAATRVELELPQTGVCSIGPTAGGAACCA